MKLPRDLSGEDLVKALNIFGYAGVVETTRWGVSQGFVGKRARHISCGRLVVFSLIMIGSFPDKIHGDDPTGRLYNALKLMGQTTSRRKNTNSSLFLPQFLQHFRCKRILPIPQVFNPTLTL